MPAPAAVTIAARPSSQVDHGAELLGLDAAFAVTHGQRPALALLVEARLLDLSVEAEGAPHVVLVGAALEVRVQFVALGIELGPVVAGLERVGVKVNGRVDTTAGILVFVPGATHGVVLFEDGELEPGLSQLDRAQARHAGADHGDSQVMSRRGG